MQLRANQLVPGLRPLDDVRHPALDVLHARTGVAKQHPNQIAVQPTAGIDSIEARVEPRHSPDRIYQRLTMMRPSLAQQRSIDIEEHQRRSGSHDLSTITHSSDKLGVTPCFADVSFSVLPRLFPSVLQAVHRVSSYAVLGRA
jgi:hypothetical protein